MKIIDIHNHLYPIEWIQYLAENSRMVNIKKSNQKILIYFRGSRLATIERKGHTDLDSRIIDMDENGIDVQIMSLSTPSVELTTKKDGIRWASKINDYFAEVSRKNKGRLYFYAVLPLQDVYASVKELERAKNELSAKGAMIFSNVRGKPIYFQEFFPIFEAASSLDIPILLHPGPPIMSGILEKIKMPLPLYGFVLDTTVAITGLIYFGVFDRFPNLKIIHPHLGGVFPYLVGRVNDAFFAYRDDYGFSLKNDPSLYYKQNVYLDTISFHLPSLKCALEYVGADHILFGTDYAHPIGSIDKARKSIESLELSEQEKKKIFATNAEILFGVKNE